MRLGSLDSGWWYVRSPRPPTHFATICKIVRGRVHHHDQPWSATPPEKGTKTQIRAAREVWKEAHYKFHLCQAVERSLISQVVAAVESPYLAALRNTNTSCYMDSILESLQHLSTTYGHITPQQLKAKTCTTTESKIELHKASIIFSGLVANRTVETTSLNTIHQHIICRCAHSTFTQPTMYLTCEGVLVCMCPTHCRP